MSRLLRVCLWIVPLFLIPAQVHANYPIGVVANYGFSLRIFNGSQAISLGQAGPWYTYWPYEAHFQTPAPTGVFPFYGPPAPFYQPAPTFGQMPQMQWPAAYGNNAYDPGIGYGQ